MLEKSLKLKICEGEQFWIVKVWRKKRRSNVWSEKNLVFPGFGYALREEGDIIDRLWNLIQKHKFKG